MGTYQSGPIQAAVAGVERVIATAADDTLTLSSHAEYAQGGRGNHTIRGGAGDDVIYGDDLVAGVQDGADQLYGDDGADFLVGLGGNDTLFGGAGNDVLDAGAGSNSLDGGDGQDVVVYGFARSLATITYGANSVMIETLTGNDILRGVESLRFSDGVYDIVDGRVSDQPRATVSGTAGADRLVGTAGVDILTGQAGNDTLRGGGWSEAIDGGTGSDTADYAGLYRSYSSATTARVSGG